MLLALRRGSPASTFLPPFPRRSFAFCASRGRSPLRYHEGSDSCTAHPPPRSPRLLRHTFLSFRLQPRGLPDHRLPPRQRDQRVSDFAMNEQARRSSPPNRVRSSYGPTVRLRLLSTSPHGDAVTFGYGVVAYSDTDFHRADVAPSWAHSFRRTPASILIRVKSQIRERRIRESSSIQHKQIPWLQADGCLFLD